MKAESNCFIVKNQDVSLIFRNMKRYIKTVIFCIVSFILVLLLRTALSRSDTTVCVIPYHHFDPVWLRSFDKGFEYSGHYIAPYRLVESEIIKKYLEYCRDRDYSFVFDGVFTLRKFLESSPESLPYMKELMDKGKFELVGAMETTPDTNLPCGECLVRNILYGKLWLEDTFKREERIAWLMDIFGMSAQLPQILKKSEFDWLACKGRPFFLDRFKWWEGIEGTKIYCGDFYINASYQGIPDPIYCPQCGGYGCEKCKSTGINRMIIPDSKIDDAFRVKIEKPGYYQVNIIAEEALPNPKLSRKIAFKNLTKAGESWKTGTYTEGLEILAGNNFCLPGSSEPLYRGDFNPVFTGCYVSRIDLKLYNRKCENALIGTEKTALLASLRGYEYPGNELRELWKELVFTDFHDAITGSHVDPVYGELINTYKDILLRTGEIENKALSFLTKNIDTAKPGIKGTPVTVFNSLSWKRDGLVSVELALKGPAGSDERFTVTDPAGEKQPVEEVTVSNNGRVKILFFARGLPSLGYRTYYVSRSAAEATEDNRKSAHGAIENDYYRITVDKASGGITSIYDKKAKKEILDTGKFYGNELCIQEDRGSLYCTQAFGKLTRLGGKTVTKKLENTGSVQKIITTGSYENNKWRQEVRLYRHSPLIDFVTHVDWDTADKRLRVVFPTRIKKDSGIYEIPYGTLIRNNYEFKSSSTDPDCTTCGDWPAQNWVEVADENYGVALINSGIPSHKIEGGVIYLSVLRSPTEKRWGSTGPIEGAKDKGPHEFRYSLYPHKGSWINAGTVRRAYEFNSPPVAAATTLHKGAYPPEYEFCRIKGENIVVSSIKTAEKNGRIVLRLYNSSWEKTAASLAFDSGAGIIKAYKSNLLERNEEDIPFASRKLELPVLPFEIVTLLLETGDSR